MCLYVVAVAVVESSTDQDAPASLTSILYPVSALVPVSAGAVHDRSIAVFPSATALRLVGGPGPVVVGAPVVALATSEVFPDPTELIAATA